MHWTKLQPLLAQETIGEDVYRFASKLFPICRSITGDGVRETLTHISKLIPLSVQEVPTGTRVFDWTVPKEWNIRDAYIKDMHGTRIVDFHESNLHVVSYSTPVAKEISLSELKKHLWTDPDHPDVIPYRTSYYEETWGFCLSHNQLLELEDQVFEVRIDSELKDGSLTYGEFLLEGDTQDEILLSAHICHPSLANDNLSGIAVLTHLAKHLSQIPRRYTYRFVFAPGTIGSITWLARNEATAARIKHGLTVSCVGDSGDPNYKRSRQGHALIDKAVEHVLQHYSEKPTIHDFSPYGYDERQYCSPGFNLPVGLFERSKFGEFPEYHTSADNLSFIEPAYLRDSYQLLARIINVVENDRFFLNMNPKCEPQLGKRGIYSAMGGDNERKSNQMAMLWVLNLSDGDNSLLDIAIRSGLPFDIIGNIARLLEDHDLIKVVQ